MLNGLINSGNGPPILRIIN
jgi:hypothetical protein